MAVIDGGSAAIVSEKSASATVCARSNRPPPNTLVTWRASSRGGAAVSAITHPCRRWVLDETGRHVGCGDRRPWVETHVYTRRVATPRRDVPLLDAPGSGRVATVYCRRG